MPQYSISFLLLDYIWTRELLTRKKRWYIHKKIVYSLLFTFADLCPIIAAPHMTRPHGLHRTNANRKIIRWLLWRKKKRQRKKSRHCFFLSFELFYWMCEADVNFFLLLACLDFIVAKPHRISTAKKIILLLLFFNFFIANFGTVPFFASLL